MRNFSINARFVEEALIPAKALDCDYHGDNSNALFITNDGIKVKMEFVCSMNNVGDFCIDYLESYCRRRYNTSFQRYREMWKDKLGYVDTYWHIVKMHAGLS